VDDGDPLLSLLDIRVARNAYGRQVDSFEADVPIRGQDHPVRAVFIRAPVVEEVGPEVEVLAELDGRPIVVGEGRLLAAAFHPELAGDGRLHRRMLEQVG
jgi:pyridoxal 5'-phosphate synthase pdxT subunit